MIQLSVNPQKRVLTMNIDAPLASANVRQMSDHLSAEVQRAGAPLKGVLIVAAQFPPWRDLSSFLDNLRAVRDNKAQVARVAVVTEASPAIFAAALGNHFPNAEIDRFAAHAQRKAESWLASDAGRVEMSRSEDTAEPDLDAPEVAPEPASYGQDMDSTGVVEIEADQTQGGEEDDWFV